MASVRMGQGARRPVATSVTQAFERFLQSAVNLTEAERAQASLSHNHLRHLIKSKAASDPTLFRLMPGDFLTGSYDRETKIRPLDDIDLFLILDGTGLSVVQSMLRGKVSMKVARRLLNPLLLPRYLTPRGYVSSFKVLRALREALAESYPRSFIRRDGQAVNVRLGSYKMGLDVVPALYVKPSEQHHGYYYIPAGRASSLWLATNPKIDAEFVRRADEYHKGRFRPVVRLLKWWNVVRNQSRLRSYHLEVLCLLVFRDKPISGYPAAIAQFFREAQPLLAKQCPDPTGLGPHIDRYLSAEARELSIEALQKASRVATSALRFSLFGKEAVAIRFWGRIFGPRFPVPPAPTLSPRRYVL